MSRLYKFVSYLTASLLLPLVLSSGAAFGAGKQYTLAMTTPFGTVSPTTVVATFTNKDNSSFNSLTLQLPANYSLVGTPTISTNKGTPTYNSTTRLVTVVDIGLPVGSGNNEIITVTMTGVATSGNCGTGVSGNWTAAVWSGSSLNGAPFSPTGPAATTSLTPQCFTITPSSSGNGTISPATVQTVAPGTNKVFTLTPATGYNSASVTGTCGGTLVGNTFTTLAVSGSCTVIANFALNVYTVTPSAGPNGSISPPTAQPVTHGGTKSFTLSPATGYHVVEPVGGTCGGALDVNNIYKTAAVTGDCTVAASFARNAYIVTPSPGPGGSMTPSTAQTVLYGDTVAFTVSANTGFYTTAASGCGGSLVGTTFTTAAVDASCTVSASFDLKKLKVTAAPTSAVAGTPFDVVIGSTPKGATVTFSAGCQATATSAPSGTLLVPTTTFTINIANPGTCTMTFSDDPDNFQPVSLTDFKVYKGVLDCGDYDSVNGPSDASYDPDLATTSANTVGLPTGMSFAYVGTPGWGLRRGPNKDGSACVKVNYSCDLNPTTNVASCTFDKASGQLATFKYLFLWGPRAPDSSGWTNYRPQVSWNIANPSATFLLPDWVPLQSCLSDQFPVLPTLPTTILPKIPSVPPFTDTANVHDWYQPWTLAKPVFALVCGAQQGWTSVGAPGNPLLQVWDIVIDESDVQIKGP